MSYGKAIASIAKRRRKKKTVRDFENKLDWAELDSSSRFSNLYHRMRIWIFGYRRILCGFCSHFRLQCNLHCLACISGIEAHGVTMRTLDFLIAISFVTNQKGKLLWERLLCSLGIKHNIFSAGMLAKQLFFFFFQMRICETNKKNSAAHQEPTFAQA